MASDVGMVWQKVNMMHLLIVCPTHPSWGESGDCHKMPHPCAIFLIKSPGKPHPIPHLGRVGLTIDRCMLHGVQDCSVFQGEDQLS